MGAPVVDLMRLVDGDFAFDLRDDGLQVLSRRQLADLPAQGLDEPAAVGLVPGDAVILQVS